MELELEPTTEPTIITKANELKSKRALPPKPGNKVSFGEMNDWLRLLTPEMMQDGRVVAYLYRLNPKVNNQLVDPNAPTNIEMIMVEGPIAEEYVRATHGGGRYKFIVKDTDNPSDSKGYFEASLTISMQEFPPVLDLRTVEWGDRSNAGFRTWALGKGLITQDNMPVDIKVKGDGKQELGSGNQDTVALMKMMLEYTMKMSEKDQQKLKHEMNVPQDSLGKNIGEILLEKMKQDDPNKQMTTIMGMIAAIQKMQPEPAKVVNPMDSMTPILTMMMESQKQTFQMLMALLTKQNDKPEGSTKIGELKELVEVAQALGGGGGEKKSTTEVIMEGLSGVLGPALNLATTFIAAKSGQPIPKVMTDNQQAQTGNVSMDQTPQVSAGEAAQIIGQYGPIILHNQNNEGWEFAEMVGRMFGETTLLSTVKYGVQGLLDASKSVTPFWEQITKTVGEEHYIKWITSFVNYKEEIAKIEGSEE